MALRQNHPKLLVGLGWSADSRGVSGRKDGGSWQKAGKEKPGSESKSEVGDVRRLYRFEGVGVQDAR